MRGAIRIVIKLIKSTVSAYIQHHARKWAATSQKVPIQIKEEMHRQYTKSVERNKPDVLNKLYRKTKEMDMSNKTDFIHRETSVTQNNVPVKQITVH